jgi:6-phosphofructokinase 2
MKSFDIVTLTVSPALDKSAHFSGLVPEQKIRCQTPLFDAGGGGINVSKAISTRGKITCSNFWRIDRRNAEKLYKKNQFLLKPLTKWDTENFVAVDDNTNSQFRFVFRHHPLQSLKR